MAPFPGDSSETPVWHLDAARGPSTPSLNDLVGAGEQRWRHVEAERPRSIEVDHQLEFGRLQNRQVRRLCALKDAPRINSDLAKSVEDVGSVAHQSTNFGVGTRGVRGRKRIA